jgi:hypothetical protein
MSERTSANGSAGLSAESVATIASSANGANPEGAVGVADGSAETTAESPTASEHAETAVSGAVDEGTDFVAELVHALQTTVAHERARIGEETERRRQALVDQVRAREASEVERIRELAAEDMKAIEAWVAGEKDRIRRERERRTTELNEDLELSLSEHHSKIEVEVQSVEGVIATYRADVEAFFERLDGETDLVMIAQQAARRPAFPTLDSLAIPVATDAGDAAEAEPVTAEASPADVDDGAGGPATGASGSEIEAGGAETGDAGEPTLVGVMDPEAAAEPVESWAAPQESSPEPVPAGSFQTVDDGGPAGEQAEPVSAAIGSSGGNSGSLLQSIPVKQPMGWLRRHVTSGDQAHGES